MPSPTTNSAIAHRVDAAAQKIPVWLYPALFAASLAAYWAPRIFRGFWVDEAGTYWMVHEGWRSVWHQLSIVPSESIIYGYIAALFASAGDEKEFLLRLPSVAAMLVSAVVVYKLSERIAGPGSGWPAAIPFVCAGAIVETATNARPYALGVAVVLLSVWSLREWVHTGSGTAIALYCISSACVLYSHYLFGLIFIVEAIYIIVARRTARFSWWPILGAAAAIGVAALPLVWRVLGAEHLYQGWGRTVLPTALTFVSLYPIQVFVPLAVGLILYRTLYKEWFQSAALPAQADLVLLFLWLLLAPVTLFVLARTSSHTLFATRYLIYALPPFFILSAWCLQHVKPERAKFAVVFAVFLSAALYVPQMRNNEWRTPLTMVRRLAGSDTPVLLRSGVVQSAVQDWKSGNRKDSFLFAALTAYPLPNEIIPVPFFVDTAAEEYLEGKIQQSAASHRRFLLVAEKGTDALSLLSAWFRQQGYMSSTSDAGGFDVVLFERGTAVVADKNR